MGKKRGRILYGALLAAVLGGLAWVVLRVPEPPGPPEPVYDGHPLGLWVAGFQGPTGPPKFDSNAIPYLVWTLKRHDGPLRRAANAVLDELPPQMQSGAFLPQFAWVRRFNACQFLNQMGATARPAIPELLRVLAGDEQPAVRAVAAGALGNIAGREDQPVVAALATAAQDKDAMVNNRAGLALKQLDPAAAAKAGVK
jgi:hypothetical protein